MKALKFVRIALAVAMFACLNLSFFGFAHAFAGLFRIQLFPAVLAMNLVAIVAVLAVTALFGRVYCSVACPMGIFQDVVIRLSRWWRRKLPPARRTVPSPPKGVRYVALAFAVVATAAGFVSVGALLDGYSLYGRIATHLFRPLYSFLHNLAAAGLAGADRPVLFREEIFVRGTCALVVAVLGLVGVAALAWWRGRLFCNTLCPVGSALALAARRPLVRIAIDPAKCVKCGLCSASCKCGAIDRAAPRVDDSACVRCLDCLAACRKGAISLTARAGARKGRAEDRRHADLV